MKYKKIIKVLIIFSFISILASYNTCTATADNFNFNSFDGEVTEIGNVTNMINTTSGTVIAVARTVCAAIAIVMLLVISMKYMMSAPGDRADIKKHAVNYVIGAFVMFGVVGILSIIDSLASILN